LNNNKRG